MESAVNFENGDKVKHPKFGTGTVTGQGGYENHEKVIVKFSGEIGEKTLIIKYAKLKKIHERPTLEAAQSANEPTETA
ncbi:MAG: hypothetical protein WCK47_00690 [bacterium]|nr:hypothetical protein [Candidatus Sumerlaeota bacterium]